MRLQGGRYALIGQILALAVVIVFLTGRSPDAEATSKEIRKIVATCHSGIGIPRKARLIERLCVIDTTEARQAVAGLADAKDDKLAVLALGALCRKDWSGARRKIKAVLEDGDRSDTARSAAMAAYCRLCKDDGDSWGEVSGYVDGEADGNEKLKEMAQALEDRLFGTGGGR